MKIGAGHLSYCTNIHPGETWPEVRDNLENYLPRVKARVSPDAPLGVGLRLSNVAAEALSESPAIEELAALLERHDLYVFTLNGFPYGRFHGARVKSQVYRPDWTEPERVAYTLRLADILARLLPAGVAGSISTVPGAFAPRVSTASDVVGMAAAMLEVATHLHRLEQETGKTIGLALEPEPCCFIETIDQAVGFFQEHLFSAAGLAQDVLRRHLGLCLDTCHAAVEFESARVVVEKLSAAGIEVMKLQLSSALRVNEVSAADIQALAPFDEQVYLHQVVKRDADGALTRYPDLVDAIRAYDGVPAEWRIHFHVPIFTERLDRFDSTQNFLEEVLDLHLATPLTTHLEVETYTWDVLPERYRKEAVEDAVARELLWVLERLGG